VVTLEHVREPSIVMCELARILKSGGRLMIVAPHEWEEHQQPHDYYRYTRYGLEYLMKKAGLGNISIDPVGGFFRMLSRRLLNSLQFFPSISWIPAALLFGPPALIMPVFDPLDKKRNFTLGYICTAEKL
jgi:SAM-dependent methyltransferase